jgi:hypothetical protein
MDKVDQALKKTFSRSSTRGSHTHGSLEGIIDPPLETSEGTDHDNTSSKTTPDTTKAKLAENLTSRLATLGSGLALLGSRGTLLDGL